MRKISPLVAKPSSSSRSIVPRGTSTPLRLPSGEEHCRISHPSSHRASQEPAKNSKIPPARPAGSRDARSAAVSFDGRLFPRWSDYALSLCDATLCTTDGAREHRFSSKDSQDPSRAIDKWNAPSRLAARPPQTGQMVPLRHVDPTDPAIDSDHPPKGFAMYAYAEAHSSSSPPDAGNPLWCGAWISGKCKALRECEYTVPWLGAGHFDPASCANDAKYELETGAAAQPFPVPGRVRPRDLPRGPQARAAGLAHVCRAQSPEHGARAFADRRTIVLSRVGAASGYAGTLFQRHDEIAENMKLRISRRPVRPDQCRLL